MTTRGVPVRDTDASPFAVILAELLQRIPGGIGAVLVDDEGECVDYTGFADPYDLKVAGAHFTVVLAEARAGLAPFGSTRTVLLRATAKSFLVRTLHDSYSLIVVLRPRAGVFVSTRAIARCERALAAEASWPVPVGTVWHPLRVECRARRPLRVGAPEAGSRMHGVDVLGALVFADASERGYRLRLDTGAELTVVREPGAQWYSEEPLF